METRFPGIDWFCDNCGAYLNNQSHFDDRKYIWKCKKCGYKNSISAANIRFEDPILHKILGFILGVLRSLLLYVVIVLSIGEYYCNFHPLLIGSNRLSILCLAAYIVVILLSLFFERVIAKYGIQKSLVLWVISTIPFNILGDFIRPLREVLSFPFALINLIRLKLKVIPFRKYFRTKCLYALSYLLLLLAVFILFLTQAY